jgi:hypothetical protein
MQGKVVKTKFIETKLNFNLRYELSCKRNRKKHTISQLHLYLSTFRRAFRVCRLILPILNHIIRRAHTHILDFHPNSPPWLTAMIFGHDIYLNLPYLQTP